MHPPRTTYSYVATASSESGPAVTATGTFHANVSASWCRAARRRELAHERRLHRPSPPPTPPPAPEHKPEHKPATPCIYQSTVRLFNLQHVSCTGAEEVFDNFIHERFYPTASGWRGRTCPVKHLREPGCANAKGKDGMGTAAHWVLPHTSHCSTLNPRSPVRAEE